MSGTHIPREQAQAKGWKVIKTRRIDINKGDDVNPVYRSRLVGKELNTGAADGKQSVRTIGGKTTAATK